MINLVVLSGWFLKNSSQPNNHWLNDVPPFQIRKEWNAIRKDLCKKGAHPKMSNRTFAPLPPHSGPHRKSRSIPRKAPKSGCLALLALNKIHQTPQKNTPKCRLCLVFVVNCMPTARGHGIAVGGPWMIYPKLVAYPKWIQLGSTK